MVHTLHVEICLLSATPTTQSHEIEEYVKNFIKTKYKISNTDDLVSFMAPNTSLSIDISEDNFLHNHVSSILIDELENPYDSKGGVEIMVYAYHLYEEEAVLNIESSEDNSNSSNVYLLPTKQFKGLWESLHFDGDFKNHLLSYLKTLMTFNDRGVDPTIVSYNGMIVLHGPPGTGKTTLAKALANKAAIYFAKRYSKMEFIEINSHNLFSKFFSESGKRVLEVFEHIRLLSSEPNTFIFAVIDEIESLSTARKASSGSDPSDAIRVVNALLTQIDSLSKCKNIMLLTTTNLTELVDEAFLDRADLKLQIGLPSLRARYAILKSCVIEMMDRGFIFKVGMFFYTYAEMNANDPLWRVAQKTEGYSGRSLRKLPCQTFAQFLKDGQHVVNVVQFLQGVEKVIQNQTCTFNK